MQIPALLDNLSVFNVAFVFSQCRYACLYGMGQFWSIWNAIIRLGTSMEKSSRTLEKFQCSGTCFMFWIIVCVSVFCVFSSVGVVDSSSYFTIVTLSVFSWSRLSLYQYSIQWTFIEYILCAWHWARGWSSHVTRRDL